MTCAARAEDAWNHGGMYAGVAGGYSTGQLSAPGFTVGDQGLNGGAFIGYGIVGKSGLYLGIEADAMVKDVTWRVGDAWCLGGPTRVGPDRCICIDYG